MNKKYRNIIIIIASVSSAILGGQVINNYGWIAGIFTAAFIGTIVGIVGRVVIKKRGNSNKGKN
ncbi:MAG: glycerol transporter [Leptotrichia sp.]|nr:glycerol transporter [Leptotrichia sp.]